MTIPALCPGPTIDPRQFWDSRYAAPGFAYGTAPNDLLRQQATHLPRGQALCLAEGEGRNGVRLAELGHTVDLQDLSAVGLAKARQLAAERGVTVQTHCCDLRAELQGLDLLICEERQRWIEEDPLPSRLERGCEGAGAPP